MHTALARPPGSSSSTSAAALRHRPPPPPSPSPAARAIAAASSAPNPPMRVSDSADCVDGAVGTIVWVRRRNGSWWPGRILGPEELSASHVMSPRSGTPVKLLGREDASVDWYNLEKSKRVKAFRCGEFDACIERAEASQGIPIKKREKYARREDAILHALELEMQQEMKLKKPGNISDGISNKTSGAPTKELSNFSSEAYMRNDDPGLYSKSGSLKYHQIGSSKGSSKTVVPHEEDNISKSLYIHKMKSSKKLGCKEDTSEAIPQMRGLQDFDLQIAPSKRKLSHSVTWETSGKPVNNNVDILSGAWHNMAGAIHTGGSKSSISIKRKRSDDGMVAETLFRKRDGHQPLVQVVHNSAAHIPISHSSQLDYDAGVISREDETNHMDAVCRAKQRNFIYLPANSNESLDHSGYHSEEMDNSATQFRMDDQLHRSAFLAEEYTSSALIEATESDSSDRVSREDEMEEGNVLRDKCVYMNKEELPLSSCISQLHLHEKAGDTFADIGVYSWHIKGRRNSRNFAKRAIDETGRKFFINVADKYNGSAKRMVFGGKGHSFKMGRMECLSQRTSGQGLGHKKEFSRACDRDDLVDMNLGGIHLSGHGSRKYPFPLLAAKDSGMSHSSFNDSDSDSQLIAQSGWEADGPSHATARMYWGESDDSFEPVYTGHINDETESMLVDVDLKVKAMYQGEHVPLVSLMSRLNGKAIIGHPVHVEILEDGSSGHVFSGCLDESIAPTAVWMTARRTAMQRIPRSQPETSAFESEDTELIQYSDCENKSLSKEYSSHFSHQAQIAKKSISHACRPMPGKSHKKPPKRVSLFSNQKTRTLSSFANDQKRRRDNTGKAKLSRGGNIFGSMINPEAVVPLVTRVPVKVVFSRILEAIRRPSTASANRVRMTSPAVRDPS